MSQPAARIPAAGLALRNSLLETPGPCGRGDILLLCKERRALNDRPAGLFDTSSHSVRSFTSPMEMVAELLRGLRLRGAVFVDARLTAPWSIAINIAADDCTRFMPRPAGVIDYHVILEGSAIVQVEGVAPARVSAGGVVLFPRNDTHVVASHHAIPPIPAADILRRVGTGGPATIEHGGGGAPTHLVCGFLAGNTPSEPLFAALPRMMVADLSASGARDWIAASVRFAATEIATGRMASSVVMTHLSETLLIEAIRAFCAAMDADEIGWLRGASDPRIGRALALIHGRPMMRWTVDQLAREEALSRTAFVQRFTEYMGRSPIAYCTALRLRAAMAMLQDTRKPIAEIAEDLSYGSEAAFSRAFKRAVGTAPSAWRRAHVALGTAAGLVVLNQKAAGTSSHTPS